MPDDDTTTKRGADSSEQLSRNRRRSRWDDAQPDTPPNTAATDSATGPKLTPKERVILKALIAQLQSESAVRWALAQAYPDFPTFDRSTFYRYKQQVHSASYDARAVQNEALQRGIAVQGVRLANMDYRYQRLAADAFDGAGRPNLLVQRELRELERAAREELGIGKALPARAVPLDDAEAPPGELDQAIDALIDERNAMRRAWAGVPESESES